MSSLIIVCIHTKHSTISNNKNININIHQHQRTTNNVGGESAAVGHVDVRRVERQPLGRTTPLFLNFEALVVGAGVVVVSVFRIALFMPPFAQRTLLLHRSQLPANFSLAISRRGVQCVDASSNRLLWNIPYVCSECLKTLRFESDTASVRERESDANHVEWFVVCRYLLMQHCVALSTTSVSFNPMI